MTLLIIAVMWCRAVDSYIRQIGDCAKRSPELIQLLELHSQFAALTPYTQVYTTIHHVQSSLISSSCSYCWSAADAAAVFRSLSQT